MTAGVGDELVLVELLQLTWGWDLGVASTAVSNFFCVSVMTSTDHLVAATLSAVGGAWLVSPTELSPGKFLVESPGALAAWVSAQRTALVVGDAAHFERAWVDAAWLR